MEIKTQNLEKSQVKITVTLPWGDVEKYQEQGAQELAKKVKIEGFRPGKVPMDVLKQKVGEMAILEEAAYIAINKTMLEAIEKAVPGKQAIGQPKVNINKLASGSDLEYQIEIALLPKTEVGKYKDLGIEKEKVEIDDKEMERTLKQLADMRTQEKIVEREVKDGDKVLADIEMFQDNVPVEGGQSKDAPIIMGQDAFISGLDEKLLGAKKGDVRDFSLPFPANHHQKNLAGQKVDFKVTIKDVYERQVPEINDEFAQGFQFKDLKDLKENLGQNIKAEKEQKNEQKTEIKILEEIMKHAKFDELPDVLIENETKNMMAEIKQSVEKQGGKFEDYLQSLGKNEEQIKEDLLPEATKRVKIALIIKDISKKEDIAATDKEVEEKIEEIKKQHADNKEVQEMVKSEEYRNYVKNLLTNQKVVAKLKEWNTK
jgi:trigger factor